MANFHFSPTLNSQLTADERQMIETNLQDNADDIVLGAFFDARGLACPMPLLKAKIALRQVADGESLYLIASDKNSQTDLVAFCAKQGHEVKTWQSNTQTHNIENYFHFIITKKAGV